MFTADWRFRVPSNEQAAKMSRRQVFREEIRDIIRDEIFSGELKPSDRVIETYWANRCGVSQGPVREALRDLEAIGLVETIPFKGTRVKRMTEKDIRDNYAVRICLEVKSIKDTIDYLTEEQRHDLCDRLDGIVEQMKMSADAADLSEFTRLDTAFHREIIEAVDNEVLLKLWQKCNMRNWFLFSKLNSSENLLSLHNEHKQLVDALREGRRKEAAESLESHVTHIMDQCIMVEDEG